MEINAYQCPLCGSAISTQDSTGIICMDGHSFPFIDDTEIPVFDSEDEAVNEYTVKEAAEIHDNSLIWLLKTFSENELDLRTNLISRLRLQRGQKVLITGAGAGNDLPYIAPLLGEDGHIFAQDYASQMLASAAERCDQLYGLSNYKIEFSVSDATNLPFCDDYFDAVYHFGGLNLFTDIARGIAEMDRVVRDGGRVVFGDEGIPAWLKNTEYGSMIINNNPLCGFEAPLQYLSPRAREVNLSWAVGYCFYIIDYTASKSDLPIDINVPHLGKRGGSINTRYFGVLEGIDPQLKKSLYQEAEKQGLSRVAFLEKLLKNGLHS
ncbi:MAG: methyltransferase domain-containing protein [Gammaproteobacteria bacterium]|nr:methyltransferase domain-containing protein [Gammaproteobacteria bacterium]